MDKRFGIIGYGFMGHMHEQRLREQEGATVVAICDIDREKLKDVPDGIHAYDDAHEMLKEDGIDAVIISANNDQHHSLVLTAAREGKHVLCEKPAALSVAELDEMEQVCRDCGVSFTVHQQRRFDPDFRTCKLAYDGGMVGEPYTVQTSLYGFNGNMHDWHVYPKQGGGMLYDWGVHLLDQLLWMIPGRISSVFAIVRNVINLEVDDYFHIILRFENGLAAEVELGTYFLSDKPSWFERHWYLGGSGGSFYTDGFFPEHGVLLRTSELLTSVPAEGGGTAIYNPTRSFGPPPEGRIIREQVPNAGTKQTDFYRQYIAALDGKEDFLVTIPEVRRVLRLLDAVRQSAEQGRSIAFE